MRPIVLMAAEPAKKLRTPFDSNECWFDGSIGIWKNPEGNSVISDARGQATTATATREAMDQPDVHAMSTMLTRTQEGIDQAETSSLSTQITETRESIDQSEASIWATLVTNTSEGMDQSEKQALDDFDCH